MSLDKLYSIPEVAEYLGVEQTFVWRRIRRKVLPIVRLANNRLVRVRERDLQAFVESRINAPDTRRRKSKPLTYEQLRSEAKSLGTLG